MKKYLIELRKQMGKKGNVIAEGRRNYKMPKTKKIQNKIL